MAEATKEYFSIKGMKVMNARKIPGTNVICFSLIGKGLGLYNLQIVKTATATFVATPQVKGKDGKYYNQYGLYLTKEDEEKVIKAAIGKLPKEEAPADEDTL